jgi:hypothetical protein
MDPRDRLQRPIPGEGIGQADGLAHLWTREDWEERPSPVPARDRASTRSPVVRANKRLVAAGPNAPQMIRLIRYPFALATRRPARSQLIAELERPERRPYREQVEEALAERVEVRSTSPARGRLRPVAVRPSAAEPLPREPRR